MRAEPIDPAGLMAWLAALPARKEICLECGAGAAELTVFMASRFRRAIALDRKTDHLQRLNRPAHAIGGTATDLPFAANSLDLLVSLQSLHHFEVTAHLRDAKRVLRRGGVFAALCWGEVRLPSAVASAYDSVFKALQPYWEAERDWVLRGYAGLGFDGQAIALPDTCMTRHLTFDQLDLTIARWRATQRALTFGADIPDPALAARRRKPATIPVTWPLLGQVFRA